MGARSIDELPTPALLLDLDRFEANLRTMAAHCHREGCHFRPHAKTHKCPEVARRQLASGARGVSVATVAEAEAMVASGITRILLTSPIVDASKIRRMIELARSGGEVLLAVGHPLQVDRLAEAASASKVCIGVLVDLDIGDHRFGIEPGQSAIDLARRIGRYASLRIRGVQAYLGLAAHVIGYEARKSVSLNALSRAIETRDTLLKDGIDASFLSCASTGTYNIDSTLPGEIELQSGSYAFMDLEYRAIGGRGNESIFDDFQPSLTVLATVINDNHPGRVTVDAGTKAFATDAAVVPEAKDYPGLIYQFNGDEFGRITAVPGADLPRIGDRLEFYVPHCDPTVNLYDRIHAIRGGAVEEVWRVAARRENPSI
jgi:3-hydroxy-D-aspartate aldolase